MLLSCPVSPKIAGVDPSLKWRINSTILNDRQGMHQQIWMADKRLNLTQKILLKQKEI
jgi:hypothetical protein